MSLHVTDDWLEAYNARQEQARKDAKAAHDRAVKALTGCEADERLTEGKAEGESAGAQRQVSPETRGQAYGAARGATEEEEQRLLFSWAHYMMGTLPELALLFHIPNGGRRSAAEAGRFKAMGVKAGVPDLFLPVPKGGYSGLFIELKRKNGGTLSDTQRDWLDDLAVRGFRAVMCHGWEAARDVLLDYLRG